MRHLIVGKHRHRAEWSSSQLKDKGFCAVYGNFKSALAFLYTRILKAQVAPDAAERCQYISLSKLKSYAIVYSARYFRSDTVSLWQWIKTIFYLHRYCSQLGSNNLRLLFCRKFPKATDNGFIYIYKSPFIASTKDTAESVALR